MYRMLSIDNILMIVLATWAFHIGCGKLPNSPEDSPFVVYYEGLTPGFDIGVDDSAQRRNWLHDMGTYMRMAYPAGLKDGSVFIVTGAVPLTAIIENFSAFSFVSVELRGVGGGESVAVSIEDSTSTRANSQIIVNLDTTWQEVVFPIDRFGPIDRHHLRNIIRFAFNGTCAKVVDFRNVRYLKDADSIFEERAYIYAGGLLAIDHAIGDTVASDKSRILESSCDFFTINYPAGESWGSAFIFTSKVQDFSSFESLSIDMRGELGGELVFIGINDTLTARETIRPYRQVMISDEWTTYQWSLECFRLVDLRRLHVPLAILLLGDQPKTIHFRNVVYLKKQSMH